jgi:hypothetical protein
VAVVTNTASRRPCRVAGAARYGCASGIAAILAGPRTSHAVSTQRPSCRGANEVKIEKRHPDGASKKPKRSSLHAASCAAMSG